LIETGLSETLARELEQYNVQVLIVEPGALKTNFWSAWQTPKKSSVEEYTAVKQTFAHFDDLASKGSPGDASKCASRIVEVVSGKGLAGTLKGKVLRLPLGSDCVGRLEAKIASLTADLEATREVAASADHD
jgi:NAD(P)-dependent dehydrogenase (short-subunit alcohol dehydrogenase family)